MRETKRQNNYKEQQKCVIKPLNWIYNVKTNSKTEREKDIHMQIDR